jgi:hypothetical protein
MDLARGLQLRRRSAVPAAPALLAAITIAVLLLAFQQVVSGAVLQAEIRHAAALAQHNALWRCNQLSGGSLREDCRQQLASAAIGALAPQLVLNRPDRAKE